ncbi:hypothetical protein Bmyc01_32140 [Bacillus mycoides]|nr:hypothetical protein Bmyc01_32140 [Bacillus mycoides]
MPQFSELEDTIVVEIMEKQQGSEMTFSQNIIVRMRRIGQNPMLKKHLKTIMMVLSMDGI